MPLVKYLRDDHLEIVSAGDYTAQEIRQVYDEVLSDPRCPNPLPVLCVVQESSRSASADEMRDFCTIYEVLRGRIGPRIALSAHDDLHFGLCRMFAAYLEPVGYECRVFREPRLAREWLRGGGAGAAEG